MSTDFMDSFFKEVNSHMEKISSRVSEVFEIRKIKTEIDELIKTRKNKLMELGSLTFRKVERVEDIKESDITKIIEEIKNLNEEISQKKDEIDKMIEEETNKKKPCNCNTECKTPDTNETDILYCSNCGTKRNPQDKYCRQCGNEINNNI
ncbi:MAG: hypothetical protein AB7V50_09935 [Vampirovibrionia bacterium]